MTRNSPVPASRRATSRNFARVLDFVDNDAVMGALEQARPYRASAVGSWCGHGSPPGSLTQHGPHRWAGWNMPPLWHVQRGSVTSSRDLTSPGSYQRFESATPVKSPASARHAGRRRAQCWRTCILTCGPYRQALLRVLGRRSRQMCLRLTISSRRSSGLASKRHG